MPRSRTSSASELLVEVRRDDPTPLHRQLEHELRAAIRSGRLPPDITAAVVAGARRPARPVARRRRRGLRAAHRRGLPRQPAGRDDHGSPTMSPRATTASAAGRLSAAPGEAPRIDFGYGRPDVSEFPRQAWLKSIRRVMNEAPSDRFGYLDVRGAPELREALASYLNRVRGTCARAGLDRDLQRLRPGPPPRRPGDPGRRRPAHRRRGPGIRRTSASRSRTTVSRSCRSRSTTRGWTSRPSRALASTPSSSPRPTTSRPGRSCRPSGGRPSWRGRRTAAR